jgi:hypothetical protein
VVSPFVGGTNGVSLTFHELRPEVFDGGQDPFDVIIKLENKGESDVIKNAALVTLSGIRPEEFGKTEAQLRANPPDDVLATHKDPTGAVLQGEPMFVDFLNFNYRGKIAGAVAKFPLRATLCYKYSTTAVSKLCVLRNLRTQTGAICTVNEAKPLFNSGSPLQFTTLTESGAGDKIRFTVELRNAGTGDVYELGSNCDPADRTKQDRALVSISTNLPGLSCTGLQSTTTGAEGAVTLYGGSKTITCTQQVPRSDFEQLVELRASFNYEESATSEITVKSSD